MTQTSCIIGTGRKMGAATGLAHNVQGQQHSLLPANSARMPAAAAGLFLCITGKVMDACGQTRKIPMEFGLLSLLVRLIFTIAIQAVK